MFKKKNDEICGASNRKLLFKQSSREHLQIVESFLHYLIDSQDQMIHSDPATSGLKKMQLKASNRALNALHDEVIRELTIRSSQHPSTRHLEPVAA